MSTFKKYATKNITEGAASDAIKGGLKGVGFHFGTAAAGGLAGAAVGSIGGPAGALLGGYVGLYLGAYLSGIIFGGVVQKRLNSFYYECKSKTGEDRKRCQTELLKFIIQRLKSYQPKNVKEKKRIDKAINIYNTRLRKLQIKLNENIEISEAQRFGKLKGFLTGPLITGAVINVRKKDLIYHCNELEDKAEQAKCRAELAAKIKEITLKRKAPEEKKS